MLTSVGIASMNQYLAKKSNLNLLKYLFLLSLFNELLINLRNTVSYNNDVFLEEK